MGTNDPVLSGRRIKPFFLKGICCQIWSMRAATRVVSPMGPSATSPQYCWVWLWQRSQQSPASNWKGQSEVKPRDLQKTLAPTRDKLQGKERHEPARPPHYPHHWQGKFSLGTGSASSLPAPRGVSCSCQGGPCWTDKALKAPSPCQLGSGTVSLGVSSPTGLPARVCPGKQRKCIAFHFNKSQMMPFANYQNGAKVKNPLNYNTCHGPKLLWLTVLWEIH